MFMKRYLPFALALAIVPSAGARPVLAQTIHHPKSPRQVIYPNVMYPNPVQTTGSGSNVGMHNFSSYAVGQ
jgi:hypothetical protein